MSQIYYTAISAIIFALVAIGHLVRLLNGWKVQIGPYAVAMSLSWLGLVITALMTIWGFVLLGR